MKWLLTKTLGGDVQERYVEWIGRRSMAGRLVGAISEIPPDIETCDALLLTGGGDVNPALYNEDASSDCQPPNDARDKLEIALVHLFLRNRKPIFGVCRGIQILNVALGGKLIQHIPRYLENRRAAPEEHRVVNKIDSVHPITFPVASHLSAVLSDGAVVNSAHHQAVHPQALGSGLKIIAESPAGLVEAVEGVGLPSPVLAVQWHPERLPEDNPASGRLLDLMIELVNKK